MYHLLTFHLFFWEIIHTLKACDLLVFDHQTVSQLEFRFLWSWLGGLRWSLLYVYEQQWSSLWWHRSLQVREIVWLSSFKWSSSHQERVFLSRRVSCKHPQQGGEWFCLQPYNPPRWRWILWTHVVGGKLCRWNLWMGWWHCLGLWKLEPRLSTYILNPFPQFVSSDRSSYSDVWL